MAVSLDCAPGSHRARFGVNSVVMKLAAAVVEVTILAYAGCVGMVQRYRCEPGCANSSESNCPHLSLHTWGKAYRSGTSNAI
jgi:hypothetical protein